jgi:hypothetical protein
VRIADAEPNADERAEMDAVIDASALGESADAVVAAMTVPAKIRKELWQLEWDDASSTMTPRDEEAFAAYGRRVVAFFRAAGAPFGERPCETRLVAASPGVNPAPVDTQPGGVVLVNVGDADCFVRAGDLSLRVPPDEACLLSAGARPYSVVVPEGAEFGLLLDLTHSKM